MRKPLIHAYGPHVGQLLYLPDLGEHYLDYPAEVVDVSPRWCNVYWPHNKRTQAIYTAEYHNYEVDYDPVDGLINVVISEDP